MTGPFPVREMTVDSFPGLTGHSCFFRCDVVGLRPDKERGMVGLLAREDLVTPSDSGQSSPPQSSPHSFLSAPLGNRLT